MNDEAKMVCEDRKGKDRKVRRIVIFGSFAGDNVYFGTERRWDGG